MVTKYIMMNSILFIPTFIRQKLHIIKFISIISKIPNLTIKKNIDSMKQLYTIPFILKLMNYSCIIAIHNIYLDMHRKICIAYVYI